MLHPRQQYVKDIYGKMPGTLDEVAESVIAVINAQPDTRVLGFAWNIAYSNKVSNSHNAPIDGYTSWGGNNALTRCLTGFPGFTGRVWLRLKSGPCGFASELTCKTLTHTGTGGGGSYDGLWQPLAAAHYKTYGHTRQEDQYPYPCIYGWDYRFFLSDFPDLNKLIMVEQESVDKRNNWKFLKEGSHHPEKLIIQHKFGWEDTNTAAADAEFLKEYNEGTINT
jgi:hypothetical protein